MSTPNVRALDLTQRPPRSMRVRLGGYAILPRVLDKCRAVLVGKNGEYKFNCPLDQHLFNFVGIDAEAFKAEVAKGAGDSEMLAWVQANAKVQRSPWEIQQWSAYHDNRGPDSDAETLAYFANAVAKLSTTREDIRAWADMLDLDDHVSYGGQP
jgi:hypothetical protein